MNTLVNDLNAALSDTLLTEAVAFEVRLVTAFETATDEARRDRLEALSIRAQDRYVRRYSAWWDARGQQ